MSSSNSRLTRISSESSLRTIQTIFPQSQPLQRVHIPHSSGSNSGHGTPNRIMGHRKSLSDASFSEGLDVKLQQKSPDRIPSPNPSTPTNTLHAVVGSSLKSRPLSVVSDSSLIQVYQNSDADSNDDQLSTISDASSIKMKMTATATTALAVETAVATLEARSITSGSIGGVSRSGIGGVISGAVAAAIGSQKVKGFLKKDGSVGSIYGDSSSDISKLGSPLKIESMTESKLLSPQPLSAGTTVNLGGYT